MLDFYKTLRLKLPIIFLWISAFSLGFFIFSLSSQTGEETAGLSEKIAEFIAAVLFKKPSAVQIESVHYFIRQTARFVLFTCFGFLSAEAAYVTFTRVKFYKVFLFVCVVCSILAFLDEWRKQFIPGRHFQIFEAFVNIVSVWAGAIVAIIILRLFNKLYLKFTKNIV